MTGNWSVETVTAHAEFVQSVGLNVAYIGGGLVALVKSGWLIRLATIGYNAWAERRALQHKAITDLVTAFQEGKLVARP
jgi:hypothetical protein